jgi:Flp pilus assembly protein TadD
MSSARMMVLLAVISVGDGVAQHMSQQSSRDSKCVELNQMVMAQVANGRMAEAEKAFSAALTGGAERWADTCAAVVLGNMAAVVSYSGRLAEGEKLAARSVAILETLHSQDHPVLLRPLQVWAAALFEQGKRGKAREIIRRVQSIRVERPEDIALVHALTASLHHAGLRSEAEIEYRAALSAWAKAGNGGQRGCSWRPHCTRIAVHR